MTTTPSQRAIGLGEWGICRESGALTCLGLGSCIALILDDREAQIGGLAHIVLPTPSLSRDRSNPIRFAETAVPFLVAEMVHAGAVRGRPSAHDRVERLGVLVHQPQQLVAARLTSLGPV